MTALAQPCRIRDGKRRHEGVTLSDGRVLNDLGRSPWERGNHSGQQAARPLSPAARRPRRRGILQVRLSHDFTGLRILAPSPLPRRPHHHYADGLRRPFSLASRRMSASNRESITTFPTAAMTSTHSAAFDTVPIVPSISMAWTTLPTTITTARPMWHKRQTISLSRSRPRRAARSAAANTAHMATTPHAENGVGDLNRRASTTSGGLVSQSAAT